jgi:coproporphyrinogen III oxidase
VDYLKGLQDRICAGLEALDGSARFREDTWQREGGGGGRTRVLVDGGVFEKAGVNFSEVFGTLTPEFAKQLPGEGLDFTAAGVSLVLHPRSPLVPTVHANFRFLTKGDRWWFGGGGDLTPYYPFKEDVVHFHRVWRDVCAKHSAVADYAKMKKDCDEYFYLRHRQEARGVGGIFFDYVGGDFDQVFAFVRDAGDAFLSAYVPIAERRKGLT